MEGLERELLKSLMMIVSNANEPTLLFLTYTKVVLDILLCVYDNLSKWRTAEFRPWGVSATTHIKTFILFACMHNLFPHELTSPTAKLLQL